MFWRAFFGEISGREGAALFNIAIVQAFSGDALVLEYGTPASPHYHLIDGGQPGLNV